MNAKRRLVSVAATVVAVMIGGAAIAQLTDDERKCTDAAYKAARNVGNQEQKGNRTCVKDGSGSIDACVDAESLKAADKRAKLLELDDPGGKCQTTPAFGLNSDLNDVADGVENGTDNILRAAFGDPVDIGAAGDKCADSVAKRSGKSYDFMLKAFRKCAKDLGAINSINDLNGCAATAVGDAKAANFVPTKLTSDMDKKCDFTGTAPPGMEDGDCNPCGSGAACAGCLANIIQCQACTAINNEDGGSANCDLLDDGVANSSCTAPGPSCGITAAGRYTQTTTGGVLKVSTFSPFQFPSGGQTIQDVSAPNGSCVSTTVVPYPGGLTVPVFCVPALGYTVKVSQTGCGVGVIDSDGGSDLTTTEKGDTSANIFSCSATQSCASFVDSSGEIDITVGDGSADTCSGGTGNAMVSIPVNTVTWLDELSACPDPDGVVDGADTVITQFPQTLDLTSDRAIAQYNDNDPDGCSLKGVGPAGPYTQNQICFAAGNPYACCTGAGTGTCVGSGAVGACIDFGAQTVSVAGGGTVFSSAAPLHDLLFTTVQPANITGPAAFGGATCGSPPTINFAGVAHRCIIAP